MKIAKELVGYFLASAVALAIDVSLLAALVTVTGMHYLVAASLSFVTGAAVSYWLCINHVFEYRRLPNARMEFASFTIIGVTGLLLNTGLMYAFVQWLDLHFVLARLGAAGFTFLSNYAGRRLILFTRMRSLETR